MEHHEKVKLDNFKAHYSVIVSELSIVNSQLGDALRKKEEAETRLAEILVQISDTLKAHEGIVSQDKDIKASQKSRTDALDERERKLSADRQVFESYKDSENRKIEDSRVSVETEISSGKEELKSLSYDISVSQSELSSVKASVDALSSEKAQLTKKVSTLRQSKQDSVKEKEDKERTLDSSITKKEKELKEMESKLTDDRKKIGGPLKLLADRELACAKREHDFAIMYQRLNKVFEKMYPGQKLII